MIFQTRRDMLLALLFVFGMWFAGEILWPGAIREEVYGASIAPDEIAERYLVVRDDGTAVPRGRLPRPAGARRPDASGWPRRIFVTLTPVT